jgi:amidase
MLPKLKIFGSAAGPAIVEAIEASGEPPIAQMRELFDQPNVTSNSTAEFWDLCQRREEYKQAYADYWAQMGGCSTSGRAVDGVVLPVAPSSAPRAGEFHYLAYSAIANVLDLPAVAFPVAPEGYSDAKAVASLSNLSKMDEVVGRTCKLLHNITAVHLPRLTLTWQIAKMTRRTCQSAYR